MEFRQRLSHANHRHASREQSFNELEAKITELWGHLNAATYRFLMLVAEFDRREGYGYHGLANTAQWLNWQCGIRAGCGAREGARCTRARAPAADKRVVRARRDLVFQGACDDACGDGATRRRC